MTVNLAALTNTEKALLVALLEARGQVCSPRYLWESCHDGRFLASDRRTIATHIKNLRRKLGTKAWPIRTVPNKGYCWQPTDEALPVVTPTVPAPKRHVVRTPRRTDVVHPQPLAVRGYEDGAAGGTWAASYDLPDTWAWLVRQQEYLQSIRESYPAWQRSQAALAAAS